MTLKLKTLGLGILAALCVSVVGTMNASANSEGHFVTTGASHTVVEGTGKYTSFYQLDISWIGRRSGLR
jgi:hypothetical protein